MRSILTVPEDVDAAWIVGAMRMKGISRADLARKMKVPLSTLTWKINHADKLTQADIKLLSRHIGTKKQFAEALMRGE